MQAQLNKKTNNEPTLANKQQGASFLGFLVIGAMVIGVVLLALQVFPSFNEYLAIQRAVKKVAGEGGASPAEIRNKFDKSAAIDDIVSIKGADLDVTKDNADVVISYRYEKKLNLFGPVSLVIDYQGKSVGGR
jgi:hypothetical protein